MSGIFNPPGYLCDAQYTGCQVQNTGCRQGFIHSFTSQLNLSAFYEIGGARRDCVARFKSVLGGCLWCVGCFVCETRLKLSRNVNECKPLVAGQERSIRYDSGMRGADS
jgi:hypothetical protein